MYHIYIYIYVHIKHFMRILYESTGDLPPKEDASFLQIKKKSPKVRPRGKRFSNIIFSSIVLFCLFEEKCKLAIILLLKKKKLFIISTV